MSLFKKRGFAFFSDIRAIIGIISIVVGVGVSISSCIDKDNCSVERVGTILNDALVSDAYRTVGEVPHEQEK